MFYLILSHFFPKINSTSPKKQTLSKKPVDFFKKIAIIVIKEFRTNVLVGNKSKGRSALTDFKEMIKAYGAEARRLADYRKKLSAKISTETDVFKLRELLLRKSTVESERYEIIDDIRSLLEYERARENAEKTS